MKTRGHRRTAWMLLAVLAGSLAPASRVRAEPPTFEEALYLEWGSGEPAAAAELYDQMARDENRPPAERAQARLRLAYCLEKTGRAGEACEQWRELLRWALETSGSDSEPALTAVTDHLLQGADDASAGLDEACIKELLARLKQARPGWVERLEARRQAVRITLEGQILTWDRQPATPVSVRSEARAIPDLNKIFSQLTKVPVWVITADETGHFSCQLPPGEYEIVITSPRYERLRQRLALFPELGDRVAETFTLGRIEIPAEIQAIFLVGSWLDNWKKTVPLVKTAEGVWEYTTTLPPGDYYYKFVISGFRRWICDLHALEFADDGRSGFNCRLALSETRDVTFRFDENDPRLVRIPAGE